MQNIPTFEVNGKTYEIKRNRYLQAMFDEFKKELNLTSEVEAEYAKEIERAERLKKLAKRKDELEDEYLDTFDDKDKELFDKACEAYNRLIDEISNAPTIMDEYNKKTLDCGEKLIIEALQKDNKGERVMSQKDAQSIWEQFVDENGSNIAIEFVSYTISYIAGLDEETQNPFVLKMREQTQKKMKR